MCGRFAVFFTEEENAEMRKIIAEVQKKYGRASVKTGEVFPTDHAAVLAPSGGSLAPRPMRWGYPCFDTSGVMINARAETALERPIWKTSLQRRRCAIPTTGFYEWKAIPGKKKKDKYLFRQPGAESLYLAGIYNTFRGQEVFAVLTTQANQSIADVHDRMPVILQPGELEDWIAGASFYETVISRPGPPLEKDRTDGQMTLDGV